MTNAYQSTSLVVMFKAFLDSDHVTEATGKTIAITISKNGGAFGNPNAGATNATEVSGGWYKFTADTTDTNTVGPLAYRGTNADIDDVGGAFYVIPVPATQASVDTIDDFLDTEVAAIKAKTDNLPADPADASDIAALIDALPTGAENAAALLDLAAGVETGLTVRQWFRLGASALFGKASGLETTTAVYRDFGDTKDRLTATVDADGNRTAITRDAT